MNKPIKSIKATYCVSGLYTVLIMRVYHIMLLCGWWLYIHLIVSGIVFSMGPIPVCRASCVSRSMRLFPLDKSAGA